MATFGTRRALLAFSKLDLTGPFWDSLSFCTTCERVENYMFSYWHTRSTCNRLDVQRFLRCAEHTLQSVQEMHKALHTRCTRLWLQTRCTIFCTISTRVCMDAQSATLCQVRWHQFLSSCTQRQHKSSAPTVELFCAHTCTQLNQTDERWLARVALRTEEKEAVHIFDSSATPLNQGLNQGGSHIMHIAQGRIQVRQLGSVHHKMRCDSATLLFSNQMQGTINPCL